ncbi:WD40 repeat-like protein [Suhomyces tanzawaensis NRRL Y-17324]|uniref:WD40 repeat-like protein n=1 Tax=Suhomyces tanzawaensis NRRL Y-17324 TaxID=984487 RepID=A0A1E4SGL8_9ASCO|nr:WD40 repeat-like protein [Suhomyces tanzawaensis NRRL Y-17324]ODV78648.1 WD40 repeat-like protein [Suhomyces tanzawaensis NRRL Y-17324]
MFNVQDNDEEMIDEEEDDRNGYNEDEDMADEDANGDGGEGDGDGDDDEDDDDDDEEDEDNEDNDDENDDNDNDDEDGDGDDDDDDDDDAKFMDARESQPQSTTPSEAKDARDVLMKDDTDEDHQDKQRKQSGDENDANGRANAPEQDTQEDEKSPENGPKLSFREQAMTKAKIATEFDIVPSVAIPYSSQCHALAFTEGPKWILTGGEDGFIRKYDFIASIQGKSPLTMAQKHNMVDTITKAGVIASYWENEQPVTKQELMRQNPKIKPGDFTGGSATYEPKVNPVYSLDAERNGYWCLSGLLSGGISLFTMRYNEGAIQHYFPHGPKSDNSKGHNDAVSVIRLNTEQDKFLSGSWDKTIRQWDLNTGKVITLYDQCSGQVSNIQYRPQGLLDFTVDNLESDDEESTENKKKSGDNENESEIGSLFGDSDESGDDDDSKLSKPSFNNSHTTKTHRNEDIFMSSSIDGTIAIWDIRTAEPVLRLGVSEGIPPWCMSSTWSNDGDLIYAGRRNSTVEEFSIRMPHKRSTTGSGKNTMVPNVRKLLQFPKISGPVSAISTMPNDDFLLCGSNDNIRLYNLKLYDSVGGGAAASTTSSGSKKPATPFLIIPGHQGGILSNLHVDETGRFMVSASGNRGWGHSTFTDSVLLYEIDFEG